MSSILMLLQIINTNKALVIGSNTMKRIYSVWVGGVEVNDYYQTLENAKKLASQFTDRGYDDVAIAMNDKELLK